MLVEALRPVLGGVAIAALLVLTRREPIERLEGTIDTGFDRPHRVDGTWLGVEGRVETCALRSDASVWCWDTSKREPPDEVAEFPGATMFATAGTNRCALVTGKVRCNGTSAPRHDDEPINIPEPVVAITGSFSFVCARGVSGPIYCWSQFREDGPWRIPHRSGDAMATDPLVAELPPVQSLSLSDQIGCVLVDRTARCFGDLAFARRGAEAPLTTISDHARAISVGRDQRCVATDDDVACTELLPTSIIDATPRLTTTHHAMRATAIAGSEHVTCAISDRRVACWHGAAPAHDLGITDAIAITVGDVEACALTSVGELQCWSWTG